MKCEIVKDLIPLYCEGLCSDETKAAVEEHVAGCQDCKGLLEAAGARFDTPEPETYDLEKAQVLQGVKKRYSRIRWRAVLLAVVIAVAIMSTAAGLYASHVYHKLFPDYPDIHLSRMVVRADPRFEGLESYSEHIMLAWSGDKKVRELVLWNDVVDLEVHYFYTAPYHVEASGEVKDGKTTLRYEGYVTTQKGETVEYLREMTFDFAVGPDGWRLPD